MLLDQVHQQKGIAQLKPSPAEKVPRTEADEEDKARYKLDTEAQIQHTDFKISFPIAKRGKDYTRALLIRHSWRRATFPAGEGFLLLCLANGRTKYAPTQ